MMSATAQQLLADKLVTLCDQLTGSVKRDPGDSLAKTIDIGLAGVCFLTWLDAINTILPAVPARDYPPLSTILGVCREKIASSDLPERERGEMIDALHVVMRNLGM